MALPKVAIIGRPNVGKSSLLNALAGQMISIVEPTAGVTRDRTIQLDAAYLKSNKIKQNKKNTVEKIFVFPKI